jgi:two-component system, LytTR family, response regulator
MRVVIIEDEFAAAKNLVAILKEVDAEVEVLALLESVSKSVSWFQSNPAPDLVFMDIQLTDANAFKIFESCKVSCPVIFTTAFNEYAIRAFKVNSIDYILKPVNQDKIAFALNKYKQLKLSNQLMADQGVLSLLKDLKKDLTKSYKKTFLIRKKDRLLPIAVTDFAYFIIENGIVYGITRDAKSLPINFTLEEIEIQVDPGLFFRANRQFILSKQCIREVSLYFHEKHSVSVSPVSKEKIIISKAKSSEFKSWLAK